ncbi:hypothetical protein IF1G_10663 [Cordyceps javanica]|uniref:Uncharacterized protein n=1 Tax=Cordyceps javanica TaxID=43265 RepID=A0A545UMM4_9HYPO|nr:hypothetical protein IF1G_10663 [Cordyceps javanica]TQW02254.1 hypothetical protein IF2G_10262 [Cordyceps javanica]
MSQSIQRSEPLPSSSASQSPPRSSLTPSSPPPPLVTRRARSDLAASASLPYYACTNWLCSFAVVMFTPGLLRHQPLGASISSSRWSTWWWPSPLPTSFVRRRPERHLEEIDLIFAKAHNRGQVTVPDCTADAKAA